MFNSQQELCVNIIEDGHIIIINGQIKCGSAITMIRQLPQSLQSQLRSGIAVPSVTQCVEELVLNSLDAGASCIAVRLDLSEHKTQVVDNGSGMTPDTLELLAERYSTSKCHSVEDLENLRFYGYRGEALASIRDICAILEIESRSKSSLKTYVKNFLNGSPLKVEESKMQRPSHGTTVTVYNLYYRLPVRQKSMNSSLELERVKRKLESIALVHYKVSISLRNEVTGNTVLNTRKSNSVLGAFTHLFGSPRAKYMSEILHEEGHFKVIGYIGKEGHSNKNLQFIYVNNRLVLKTKMHKLLKFLLSRSTVTRLKGSRQLQSGISPSLATSPTRPTEKHGMFVLNITCPLPEYDITFEPAKTLVEFKNWNGLLKCLQDAVTSFLHRENLILGIGPQINPDDGIVDELCLKAVDNPEDPQEKEQEHSKEETGDIRGKCSDATAEKYGKAISTIDSTNVLQSKLVRRSKQNNKPGVVNDENASASSGFGLMRAEDENVQVSKSNLKQGTSTGQQHLEEKASGVEAHEATAIGEIPSEGSMKCVQTVNTDSDSLFDTESVEDTMEMVITEDKQVRNSIVDTRNKTPMDIDNTGTSNSAKSYREQTRSPLAFMYETSPNSASERQRSPTLTLGLDTNPENSTGQEFRDKGLVLKPGPHNQTTIADSSTPPARRITESPLTHSKDTTVGPKSIDYGTRDRTFISLPSQNTWSSFHSFKASLKPICTCEEHSNDRVDDSLPTVFSPLKSTRGPKFAPVSCISSSERQLKMNREARDQNDAPEVKKLKLKENENRPPETDHQSLEEVKVTAQLSIKTDHQNLYELGSNSLACSSLQRIRMTRQPVKELETVAKKALKRLSRLREKLQKYSQVNTTRQSSTELKSQILYNKFNSTVSKSLSTGDETSPPKIPNYEEKQKAIVINSVEEDIVDDGNKKSLDKVQIGKVKEKSLILLHSEEAVDSGQNVINCTMDLDACEKRRTAKRAVTKFSSIPPPQAPAAKLARLSRARKSLCESKFKSGPGGPLASSTEVGPPRYSSQNDKMSTAAESPLDFNGGHQHRSSRVVIGEVGHLGEQPGNSKTADENHSKCQHANSKPVIKEASLNVEAPISAGFHQSACAEVVAHSGEFEGRSVISHEKTKPSHVTDDPTAICCDQAYDEGTERLRFQSRVEKEDLFSCSHSKGNDSWSKKDRQFLTSETMLQTAQSFNWDKALFTLQSGISKPKNVTEVTKSGEIEHGILLHHTSENSKNKIHVAENSVTALESLCALGCSDSVISEHPRITAFESSDAPCDSVTDFVIHGSGSDGIQKVCLQESNVSAASSVGGVLETGDVPERVEHAQVVAMDVINSETDWQEKNIGLSAYQNGKLESFHSEKKSNTNSVRYYSDYWVELSPLVHSPNEDINKDSAEPSESDACESDTPMGDRQKNKAVSLSADKLVLTPFRNYQKSTTDDVSPRGLSHASASCEKHVQCTSKDIEKADKKVCEETGNMGLGFEGQEDLSQCLRVPSRNDKELETHSQGFRHIPVDASQGFVNPIFISQPFDVSDPEICWTNLTASAHDIHMVAEGGKMNNEVKTLSDAESRAETDTEQVTWSQNSKAVPDKFAVVETGASSNSTCDGTDSKNVSTTAASDQPHFSDNDKSTVESKQVTDEGLSTSSSEDFANEEKQRITGMNWICKIDPMTGNTIYVNTVTGNTSYKPPVTSKKMNKKAQNLFKIFSRDTGRRINPVLTVPGSTPWLPTQSRQAQSFDNASLSPSCVSRLNNMLEEHLENQDCEVSVSVKWRDGKGMPSQEVEPIGITQLFEEWDNPVFHQPEQDIVNLETGQGSRGANKVHQYLHPHKFDKEMFTNMKVIQQVDKKFIACLINMHGSHLKPDMKMVVIVDQHAAHERVRLERLISDACEMGHDERRQIKCADVTPAVELSLTQEELRVMTAYRREMHRTGIKFSVAPDQRDIVLISSIPACFVEREANELKRKRPAVAIDIVETLIKEQVKLLQDTGGACATLPKVISRVLNSQACHGAIKFGDKLSIPECEELIQSLSKCQLPFQCAHGRPSIMPLIDFGQLERKLPDVITRKPQLWKLRQMMETERQEKE